MAVYWHKKNYAHFNNTAYVHWAVIPLLEKVYGLLSRVVVVITRPRVITITTSDNNPYTISKSGITSQTEYQYVFVSANISVDANAIVFDTDSNSSQLWTQRLIFFGIHFPWLAAKTKGSVTYAGLKFSRNANCLGHLPIALPNYLLYCYSQGL